MKKGIIKKAIAGFYYVYSEGETYECRAKGVFRNNKITPLVGDKVNIELQIDNKGTVCEIGERKNDFLRPPLANLDKLFIIISTCEPSPNILVIDKLIAVCEYKDIEPIIIITKTDLKHDIELYESYKLAGFKTLYISNEQADDFSEIKVELKDSISAFTGNTGVGKSSLLNNIFPDLFLPTSHVSKKLGRGRHTTRHVELYDVEGGYVADTPGFGSMEIVKYDVIYKDKLELCFREFKPYLNKCKFTGCSHRSEKGCAVIEGLNNGEIGQIRFNSYVAMYNEAQQLKQWEQKKNYSLNYAKIKKAMLGL